jgi:curved DNA-binding protein CbpA
LHPDQKHPAASQDDFATLNRAYSLLSKPHTRAAYLQTGHGWNTLHTGDPRADPDWELRREILARSRYRKAASDAGSGAWGGFEGTKWRPTQDTGFNMDFNAEPTYMSNPKFLSTLGLVVSLVFI